ncbi:TRF-like 10 [Euphorbia peplus]|nr:TRF-like 10 [Euphorbia peplus]
MAQAHMSTSGLDSKDRVFLRDEEIIVNEKEGEGEIEKEVGQQSNVLLEKHVSAVNSDEGKTIDEKTKEDAKKLGVPPESSQSVKPYRVPWTAEEEKMLKEGVNEFFEANKRMPWTKILEYGCSVFLSGRTAMQLKDKWRNMEKKSS